MPVFAGSYGLGLKFCLHRTVLRSHHGGLPQVDLRGGREGDLPGFGHDAGASAQRRHRCMRQPECGHILLGLAPFRNAPPKPTCDFSSVTALPCDSDFVSQYYNSQDWHAEASADTCAPCASGRFAACSDLWSGLTSQLGACFKLRRSKLRGQPTPEVTACTPSSLEANWAEGGEQVRLRKAVLGWAAECQLASASEGIPPS